MASKQIDPAPMGFARLAQFEAVRRGIQDKYCKRWAEVGADLQQELDDLDKRYWAGNPL